MQSVVVKSFTSLEREIECRVPQGSILGPLLPLMYVSEINEFVTNCLLITFVDVTVMLFKAYMVDGLFAIIETTLTQLSSYLRMNNLPLNS
jgi:hypothetical protein